MSARIGVLTFHRCINYGSYWQARCLVEGLRRRGHEAVLLDHRSARVNRAEWRCALSPHLPEPTRPDDRRAYGRKTRPFLAAFDRLPLSPPFDLDRPGDAEPAGAMTSCSSAATRSGTSATPGTAAMPLFYGEGAARAAGSSPTPRASATTPPPSASSRAFAAPPRPLRGDLGARRQLPRAGPRRARPRAGAGPRPLPAVSRGRRAAGDAMATTPSSMATAFPTGSRPGCGLGRSRAASASSASATATTGPTSSGSTPDRTTSPRVDRGSARAVVTNFFHGCVFALLHEQAASSAPPADYRANKVVSLMRLTGGRRPARRRGRAARRVSTPHSTRRPAPRSGAHRRAPRPLRRLSRPRPLPAANHAPG